MAIAGQGKQSLKARNPSNIYPSPSEADEAIAFSAQAIRREFPFTVPDWAAPPVSFIK
jgi:hypothetical protein